jgi:hypothetical protein
MIRLIFGFEGFSGLAGLIALRGFKAFLSCVDFSFIEVFFLITSTSPLEDDLEVDIPFFFVALVALTFSIAFPLFVDFGLLLALSPARGLLFRSNSSSSQSSSSSSSSKSKFSVVVFGCEGVAGSSPQRLERARREASF